MRPNNLSRLLFVRDYPVINKAGAEDSDGEIRKYYPGMKMPSQEP